MYNRKYAMRRSVVITLCIGLLLTGFLGAIAQPSVNESTIDTQKADSQVLKDESILAKYKGLQGYFTENQGQMNSDEILYYYQNSMAFTKDSVLINIQEDPPLLDPNDPNYYEELTKERIVNGVVVAIKFENSNDVTPIGINELPHKNNYFFGNDQAKWRTDVPNYGTIVYPNLYNGIDLVYRVNSGTVKYDFVVQPNANPSVIKMSYEGIEGLEYATDGSLVIKTVMGDVRDSNLFIYQENNGVQSEVSGAFSFLNDKTVGYDINGYYNPNAPLVIDPLLNYSGFIGGDLNENGWDVAVDASLNAYVGGSTGSTSGFPVTSGAYQLTFGGGMADCFIVKINHNGTALVYATYLGSSGNDDLFGLTVDSSNNAYATGSTSSTGFPTTLGAYDTSHNGASDIFVTKLNAAGSGLVYSTFIGGSIMEVGEDVTLDSSNNAYITGYTFSSGYPTTSGAYDESFNGPDGDIVVSKLNTAGSDLIYSTFIGSPGWENGKSIAVDSSGNAYVTGNTNDENFPTTSGVYDETFNNPGFMMWDGVVLKLNSGGDDLVYSTFLGGDSGDTGYDIVIDGSGNAYIAGDTASSNFPTSIGAYDTSYASMGDAFASKLSADGSSLTYSTYLGGLGQDVGTGIVVESTGAVQIIGRTTSSDFPTTPGAFDPTQVSSEAFLTRLKEDWSDLYYSTFVGGDGADEAQAIIMDSDSCSLITGSTSSSNYYHSIGIFPEGSDLNGTQDATISKFCIVDPPPTIETYEPGGTSGQSYTEGDVIDVKWYATDNNPLPALPIFIRYGSGSKWTEINSGIYSHANDGIESWDTTGVACPDKYYINVTVIDTLGQQRYDWSNYTFDLFCNVPDSFPTIDAYEPGATSGQQHSQGTTIAVTWSASDDNSLPLNPIDITYGTPGSWTTIATGEANDGYYSWDTTLVPTGTYWMNISVTDSIGQTSYGESNFSFEIVADLPPEIVVTTPIDGATVPVDQVIQITFSEAIDTGTFMWTIVPSDPGGWNWVWTLGDSVVTGTHNAFATATMYTFTVTQANDLGGKMLVAGPVPNPWDFTTSGDTTPPVISSTVPVNGASGVALAQDVVITFSEAIATGTFTYNCNPNPGSWTWVWTSGNTVATGSHNAFTESTLYTFTVTSAEDLAGNPLGSTGAPNPWDWTTLDTTPPEITDTVPMDTEIDVLLNQNVVITFSEAIDTGTFAWTITPDPSGWNWVWSMGDTVATGSHNAFTVGTLYTFTVTDADDLGGNPLAGGVVPNPWEWTTVTDVTPPEITLTDPANSAVDVGLSQDVVITFSEAIDTGTFAWTITPNPGTWNWVWSMGDTVATGSHADFTVNTAYTFTVTTADDLAGNALTGGSVPNPWSWTTTTDVTPPTITATDPVDAATEVMIDQDVVITFSEAIDTPTFAWTITPDPGGWTWVWSGGDTIVTGSHNPFAAATLYAFTVTVADDLKGNALAAGAVPNPWSWTTDATPPEITVTVPADDEGGVALGQTVEITFSEAIDTGTFAWTITNDPGGWSWVWSLGDTKATGTHLAFVQATGYTFTVTDADDLAGNALAGGAVPNPWNWTTVTDITPPEIVTTDPVDDEDGVALDQDVVITFSEAIDTGTFAWTSVPDPGSWTWVWSSGDTVATGSHTAFALGTGYEFTVTTADDLAGNTLAAGAVPNPWNWTTTSDVTPPTITVTDPANLATDVALDASVVITFSEAIDTTTFLYTSSPNPGGWTFTWSGGNTIATGTHADFALATTYTFTVTAADDLEGNSLVAGTAPNPWTFTTTSVTTGTITGYVLDGNSDPITGVTVTLTNLTDTVDTKTTSATGSYTFSSVPSGTDIYTVTASKTNYDDASEASVDVDVGGTTWVNLTLEVSATISGTVVDENGDPVSGAEVRLMDGTTVAVTTTDSNGDFSFSGIDYGDYTIEIKKDGYVDKTVDVTVDKDNLDVAIPDQTLVAESVTTEDMLWLWLLIIVIIVILVIVALLLLMRKKPAEAVPMEAAPAETAEPVAEEPVAEPVAEEPAAEEAPAEAEAEPAAAAGPVICANCGKELDPAYMVCPFCGTKR